jgi:Rieske Fe-S protein
MAAQALVTPEEIMPQVDTAAQRTELILEEPRERRRLRREKQHEDNVKRAAKMHVARIKIDAKTAAALPELKQSVHVGCSGWPYWKWLEYVAPGELGSDEVKPGEGVIVQRGLKKIAAYRDEAGALHLNSASCTHVGCHLNWNSFETCWDCPCHGSMFDVKGQPINASAIGPLAKVDGEV